jgi:hypothetical protein
MFGVVGCCMATFVGNEGFSSSQPPAETWDHDFSRLPFSKGRMVFKGVFALGCIAGGIVFCPNVMKNVLKGALVVGGSAFIACSAAYCALSCDFARFQRRRCTTPLTFLFSPLLWLIGWDGRNFETGR